MSSVLIDNGEFSSNEFNSTALSNVRTIVKFYIWPLLAIFGLTGNFLSILVLTRRRLIRTSTNNYLTILAAFDSLYLITTLMLNVASHEGFSKYEYTSTLLYILRPLADFSSNTSAWLIVCFTLERTLAVIKPIYAKRTCSVRRSRRLIGSLLLISCLITLPTFFEQKLLEKDQLKTPEIGQLEEQHHFYHNLHRAYLIFICVVIIWIPLVVICVCNSILIWYLHRSRNFELLTQQGSLVEVNDNDLNPVNKYDYFAADMVPAVSIPSNQKAIYLRRHSRSVVRKRRVTTILIVCLFVALLLWTPQSLSLTYEIFFEPYGKMSVETQINILVFNNFANLFLCINASIDFILYCFLSDKFGRTCLEMICYRCRTDDEESSRGSSPLMRRFSKVFGRKGSRFDRRESAANTTNKYYLQLYNFYRSTAGDHVISTKKSSTRLTAASIKYDKKIFYRQTLSRRD